MGSSSSTAAKEDQMQKALLVASVVGASLFAGAGVAAGQPKTNILPVDLTCGSDSFDLVVPAGGQSAAGLFENSTSVAVLVGVNGEFVPGFSEANTTMCTASFPNGESITAFVFITPRR
jgi:hypothetical protein